MGLEAALKVKVGYTEEKPPVCQNCKYSEETENSHVDRVWDWNCTRNPDVNFTIKPGGRCKHFHPMP